MSGKKEKEKRQLIHIKESIAALDETMRKGSVPHNGSLFWGLIGTGVAIVTMIFQFPPFVKIVLLGTAWLSFCWACWLFFHGFKLRVIWGVLSSLSIGLLLYLLWIYFGPQFPDVTLRFVYPRRPALRFENDSRVVARDMKATILLWNLNLPERLDPLPIPVTPFDWIKPGSHGGPQNLFSTPLVTPLLHSGDRLVGTMSVHCPDCTRGHTYIVSIVWGQDGWFSEMPEEKDGRTFHPLTPFTKDRIAAYAAELLSRTPEHTRTPIR